MAVSGLFKHYTSLNDTTLLEIAYNVKEMPLGGYGSSAFLKIDTSLDGIHYQIPYSETNPIAPFADLKNDLSRTAIQVSNDVWLQLNDFTPFENFSNSFSSLQFEPTFQNPSSNFLIRYDRIRLYFISGYQFTNIAGLICEVAFSRRDGTLTTIPASLAYIGSNNPFELLVRPFVLEQRTYDKYIEFYIPSLQQMTTQPEDVPGSFIFTDERYTELAKNANIDSAYAAPRILVSLYGINRISKSFGNQIYLYASPMFLDNADNSLKFEIPKVDSDIFLAANIQESKEGDYFEYYGVYNGNFLTEYIDLQNRKGKLMQVIHEIDVYENINTQAGYQNEILTQSFSHIEDRLFDKPFIFRPVILNGLAIAASIDYRMRLVNRLDGSMQTREASITIRNPQKYGRRLQKLNVNANPPIRIINRLPDPSAAVNSNINLLREQLLTPALYNSQFIENTIRPASVPIVPIDIKSVGVTQNSLILGALPGGSNLSDALTNSLRTLAFGQIDTNNFTNNTTVYGQGRAVMNLNMINNYVKFNFLDITNPNAPVPIESIIDDGTVRINMNFIDNNGNSLKISSLNSSGATNDVKPGEVFFNISKSIVQRIRDFTNRNFYITINSNDSRSGSSEIVLYTGTYGIQLSAPQIKALEDQLKSSILDEKIKNMNIIRDELTEITNNLIDVINRTSLSSDPNVQLSQLQDLNAFQERVQNILLNQALAEEIGVDRSTLLQKFQDAFIKATTPKQ